MLLIISQEFNDQEIWDIDRMLEKFKAEIQAREKIGVILIVNGEKDKIKESLSLEPFSRSSFYMHGYNNNLNKYNLNKQTQCDEKRSKSSGRNNYNNFRSAGQSYRNNHDNNRNTERYQYPHDRCVFYNKQYNSRFCDNITRPETRKEILFKDRRCYCCFKKYHTSSNCLMNIVCSGCKGKHHQSVCTFRNAGNNNSCNSNMDTRYVNMNNFNTGGVLVNGRQTTACGKGYGW